MSGTAADDFVSLFPAEEEILILKAIIQASASLRKKHETELENDVTNRLFATLRRLKIIRSAPFVPIREHPIFSDDDDGVVTGRIDINFIKPGGDTTYFAVEAKRLHVSFPSGWKSLVTEYVTGNQGMMCFISGKYSRDLGSGCMLGYVFDGRIGNAKNNIARRIVKHSIQLKVEPPRKLLPSQIISGEKRIDETHHAIGYHRLTLYHLLLSI